MYYAYMHIDNIYIYLYFITLFDYACVYNIYMFILYCILLYYIRFILCYIKPYNVLKNIILYYIILYYIILYYIICILYYSLYGITLSNVITYMYTILILQVTALFSDLNIIVYILYNNRCAHRYVFIVCTGNTLNVYEYTCA